DRGCRTRSGHLHVQQDDVGVVLADQLDRVGTGGALGDDLEVLVGAEQLPEALPEQRVVIGDHQPDHAAGVVGQVSVLDSGSRTSTAVPTPISLEIVIVPPTSSSRSRIEMRPTPTGAVFSSSVA